MMKKWVDETLRNKIRIELDEIDDWDLEGNRKVKHFGDKGIRYTYSGKTFITHNWITPLIQIKAQLNKRFKLDFNMVVVNKYDSGTNSLGWHSDNERHMIQ